MNSAEEQPDYCPHCQGLLEIGFVNFSFRGADIIVSCPNCAIAFTNNRTPPKPGSAGKPKALKGSIHVPRLLRYSSSRRRTVHGRDVNLRDAKAAVYEISPGFQLPTASEADRIPHESKLTLAPSTRYSAALVL